ncbi:MAG: ABC transporter permease [Clostridia bacterium]|nr:ABC transporter permease [Clostridia bacterium]
MRLESIAINNLRRRKAKMLFLVIGMVIGITTIVTLFTITKSMKIELGNKFDQIGANMLIIPKADKLTLSYGGVPVSGVSFDVKKIDSSAIDKIRTIKNKENIAVVSPKLLGGIKVNEKNALAIGIQFKNELRMKRWWKINTDAGKPEQFEAKPQRMEMKNTEVLLGSELAAKLDKKPGETVNIGDQSFTVRGVIQSLGSEEDNSILLDLTVAQEILNRPNMISMIEVSALCNTCPIEEIVAQISEKLPQTNVLAVKEAVEARKAVVDRFANFALAISVVVLLIGSLVVFLTMMGSVNERTREIGIFRSIGFRKVDVAQIILTEAAVVSILGGISGYLLGMVVAGSTAPLIAQMDLTIPWELNIAAGALGISVIVGLLASVFPAYQAAKLDPSEALRFI